MNAVVVLSRFFVDMISDEDDPEDDDDDDNVLPLR
jgi:hypothetical protein